LLCFTQKIQSTNQLDFCAWVNNSAIPILRIFPFTERAMQVPCKVCTICSRITLFSSRSNLTSLACLTLRQSSDKGASTTWCQCMADLILMHQARMKSCRDLSSEMTSKASSSTTWLQKAQMYMTVSLQPNHSHCYIRLCLMVTSHVAWLQPILPSYMRCSLAFSPLKLVSCISTLNKVTPCSQRLNSAHWFVLGGGAHAELASKAELCYACPQRYISENYTRYNGIWYPKCGIGENGIFTLRGIHLSEKGETGTKMTLS
jgi:hypothetical protein